MAQVEHEFQIPADIGGTGPIGFVDDKQVGKFEEPCLICLHGVAHARCGDDDRGVGGSGDVDLDLANPNCLDHDRVIAGGVQQTDHAGYRKREPALVAACCHRSDECVG